MNYYSALQIVDKETGKGIGKYHFCCRNKRIGTYPVGYCRDHGGHDSIEEAEECYKQYLLDGHKEIEYTDWTGCEICDEPTKKGLTLRPPHGFGHALCDEHRTYKILEELTHRPTQMFSSF